MLHRSYPQFVALVGLVSCAPPSVKSPDVAPAAQGAFVLKVDPTTGSTSLSTSGSALYSTVPFGFDGDPNTNPPGTIQAVTLSADLPGENGCPMNQNCFEIQLTNFSGGPLEGVFMGIDEIVPPTGRALEESDATPAGVAAALGGRNFGSIAEDQTSSAEPMRFSVPDSSPYLVRGRFWSNGQPIDPASRRIAATPGPVDQIAYEAGRLVTIEPASASVYMYDGNTFVPQQTITWPTIPNWQLGIASAVAMDSGHILVGFFRASRNDFVEGNDGDCRNCGSILVFAEVAGTWEFVQHLTAPLMPGDGWYVQEDHHFGTRLAAASGRLATFAIADGGPSTSTFYGYRLDMGQWVLDQMEPQIDQWASPPETGLFVGFGGAIVLTQDATRAVISLRSDASVVHSLLRVGDTWSHEGTFPLPPGLMPSDRLGYSLAIDGDSAVLAAINQNTVYIYERVSGVWSVVHELTGPPPSLGFGEGLALSGNVLAVGGFSEQTPGDVRTQVYVFERTGNVWALRETLPDTPASGYGSSNIIIRDGLFIAAGPIVAGGPSEIHVFDAQ